MIARLRGVLDVRAGEARTLLLTFLYIALVVASFLLAKPIRNGLFLNQYSAHSLVYVYVAVPLALTVFVPLYSRLMARVGQRAMISGTLLFFCLNVLIFWWLFRWRPFPALSGIFYVWVNCFGIIAPVQGWTFANSIFDTRQAKRLFPLIASGASIGAISGGLLARYLVRPVGGTVNLLLVLAGLILAAAVVMNLTRLVIPRRKPVTGGGKRTAVLAETLALIARNRYLTLIAVTVFLVAIVTQWTQFQLHLAARELYAADADRLTQFYGAFNFYLGLTAFCIQLLVTSTALRRFGIVVTLLALPVALGIGSLTIVVFASFWAVLLTNGLDQSLRFSVDKATYELLFLPLPSQIKSNVKVTIDTVISGCADGVGGLALGLATQGFIGLPGAGLSMRGLALVTSLLTCVWIVVVLALRRRYVEVIRESIRQHRLDAERPASGLLERTTADEVLAHLSTGDPDEILYALTLFEAQHGRVTHPALGSLLSHPAAAVRRKALALLRESGDRSVRLQVEALLTDDDLETRTEALLYLAYHEQVDPVARIQELGDFPDFSIRASLVAFLARPGRFQNLDAAGLLLDQMSAEPGEEGVRARLEAARLLGVLPDAFDSALHRVLQDSNADVVRMAMQSVSRQRRFDLVDPILRHLGTAELVADATTALAALGDDVVDVLSERLSDAWVLAEVRLEIPAVLVRIATPAAQRALVGGLLESDTSLRFRIISSLNKLRLAHPSIVIDTQIVETALAAEIMGHYRSYQILGTLGEALDSQGPVVSALRQSMQQEVERIFRLIGLLIRDADVYSAYLGIESGNRTVRSNALEFLDTILKPQLRGLLLPIIDPTVTVAERMRLANGIVGAPVATREEAVVALLHSDDPWLRSCGAYAVGTLGLRDLEPELDRWLEADDPLLRETARAAKRTLAGPAVAADDGAQWGPSDSMGVG